MDPLFLEAEKLATDRARFPRSDDLSDVAGLVALDRIQRTVSELRGLDVDQYVARTVRPSEDPGRAGAREVLDATRWTRLEEWDEGPLYGACFEVPISGRARRVGFLAQERRANNGVWLPEHHVGAAAILRDFASRNLPVVTLIDTPGASASAESNRANQAHSISRLIAEMAQVHVPTMGVVLGKGYSGGAIHLATVNMLVSVRDGVFNTIQPQGLSNIVRAYDLSWEQCAKAVGVSAYELVVRGQLDGVVDFVAGESGARLRDFERVIESGLASIERSASEFVLKTPTIFDHYRRSMLRFAEPSPTLRAFAEFSNLSHSADASSQASVFGTAFRHVRYLAMRRRLSSTNVVQYGRLSSNAVPSGGRRERVERWQEAAFQSWLEDPLEVRYDDALNAVYQQYCSAHEDQSAAGATELDRARSELVTEFGFHLYGQWKEASRDNFSRLRKVLAGEATSAGIPLKPAGRTVLDVVRDPALRASFASESECLICFDHFYNAIFEHLALIAEEAYRDNRVSRSSIEALLESSLETALNEVVPAESDDPEVRVRLEHVFREWLRRFSGAPRRAALLRSLSAWKRLEMPRVSESLFAVVTFLFERLLPVYFDAEVYSAEYDGRIRPRNIGVRDFWSRFEAACQDLLIQQVLNDQKRVTPRSPSSFLERFFSDVEEFEAKLMTSDPVRFPGFRLSIEQALDRGVTPCGVVTAVGRLKSGQRRRVGVLVSNVEFQAGAFDMASAEKLGRLLVRCAAENLPLVCFVSSGGMQTKEGSGSLFSMPVVVDRITRFVRDTDLPVVVFGFGDCTGGAQASFVTHPLVSTYYFSGTNMPFAGQIVVPEHLPLATTLSNYLSDVPGAMQGLVRHPFGLDLDDRLRNVDPKLPVPVDTVEDVLARELDATRRVEFMSQLRSSGEAEPLSDPSQRFRPVRRMLVHARGCTATKIVRVAQRRGIEVVLVQSDPDMDSIAARQLSERDSLVCIGGKTPSESYLNAASVVRVATREGADSLHPGIGFLSESPSFSDLCGDHGLNFIGPFGRSMRMMGNKSNAIRAALKLGVPVVPGSHGIVTDASEALEVAESIGFPVMIKAVHGGGGKGIRRVERREDFEAAFHQTSAEASSAFGDRDCYIERCVESMRHVEVQILRDRHGDCRTIGWRDCTVQRDNQKVLEESGSPVLTTELDEAGRRFAASIAEEIDYVGAGTVEFLFDLDSQSLYFMEMNTRLQVEHPVTEATSGVDIVAAQFDIASGASIRDLSIGNEGYAIEARINAEGLVQDAEGALDVRPTPGRITRCVFPGQDDIEVIEAIDAESVVSPYYDSLAAQVVCYGRDRTDCINKLNDYLDQVVIEGISTNIAMIRAVLADEIFLEGEYDTRYLDCFLERVDREALVLATEIRAGVTRADLSRESLVIDGGEELRVLAPSAGVFYASRGPQAAAFVNVGDCVDIERPLCLIEAMKMFSSVSLQSLNGQNALYSAQFHYEIVRTNAANGQTVNAGDLLFVVRPVALDNVGAAVRSTKTASASENDSADEYRRSGER